jgi:hypothetical protein
MTGGAKRKRNAAAFMHISRPLLKLLFNSDGIPSNCKTPLTQKLIIRFGLGLFRGVAAFGLIICCGFGLWQQARGGVPSPIPAYSPWNLAVLTNPPAYEVLGVSNGVTGLLFHGPPFMNNSGGFTKVFAYFSEPSSGQPPYPALVLVHGGAGRANLGWVQQANQRGYATLALTTTGVEEDTYWTDDVPAEYRGPSDGFSATGGPSPFDDTGWGDTNMWIYHAVADTILADSTGPDISWSGHQSRRPLGGKLGCLSHLHRGGFGFAFLRGLRGMRLWLPARGQRLQCKLCQHDSRVAKPLDQIF